MNSIKLQKTKSTSKIVYLHTNNKLSEKNGKIPCILASKRTRYVVINLFKEVKDLYTENYQTWMKKLKKINLKIF